MTQSPENPLLAFLRGFQSRNHRDAMSMVMVNNMMRDHKAMHHNRRRMDAQVDAALRTKCGDNYQPPDEEEDMGGITLLNSPVIGDDALKKLADMMMDAQTGAAASATASSSSMPAPSAVKKSLMQKALPYVLGATLSAGTAAAATWYLSPKDTDTNSQYDIAAVEYEPSTPTEP